MEIMNNLILGSSGFVGRYLCQYLTTKNEKVIEYDLVRNKQEDCRFSKLPLQNIDRVYFLAWKVGGSKYLYDPKNQKEQLEWNLQILNNCMSQLYNVPFVFVSSQLAENNNTIYGVLKRLGEHWTQINNGTAVRLWNVYGAYEAVSIKSHVVADFVHQAIQTNQIIMQTNGEEKRQFIYIEDVCDALHTSFNNKGLYDLTTLKWSSIYDVARIIQSITDCQIIPGNSPGSFLEVPNKPLVPGWSSQIELNVGIQKTIELFRDNNEY
jgi:nucleoside-diphosphate-sugar epimerase